MSNTFFQFKQFTINQSGAAMKVGTDGCLLGSWVPLDHTVTVLDIGTGTGLLALMIAQRLTALKASFQIDALDLDPGAVQQALENIQRTAWADKINVFLRDILKYAPLFQYDLLVCNPPYFEDSLHCPDESRTLARHNDSIPFSLLMKKASELMSESGRFCLIVPTEAGQSLVQYGQENNLYLKMKVKVHTTARKAAKRVLLEFSKQNEQTEEETLILQEDGSYTEDYKTLMKEFYLNL